MACFASLAMAALSSLRGAKRRSNSDSLIPGWSAGPDPESRDSPMCNCTSGFDAEPVIGPRFARTRWHRPGMTASMPLPAAPSPGNGYAQQEGDQQ
jgi:hypothetical protein